MPAVNKRDFSIPLRGPKKVRREEHQDMMVALGLGKANETKMNVWLHEQRLVK